ncbi:DUF6538 domain-containing protein [Blastomonas marina]|uniref:DUF6538 domain-containing protein n=1 Tax=Blastomonas marina TaxID=1867408 RepID=UPI002AC8A276|nr:DUF6538 domain-containing protein [Blastomonas marina]WPZ03070.1 DUF6538 domain-containing protein [Blastomonas marina]
MKKVRGSDYLSIRSGIFYFRRAVPPDARSLFGKGEVVTSLKTKDLAEARHLLIAELRGFEAKLARCRGVRAPAERAQKSGYTPSMADIEMVVRQWLVERDERMDARNSRDHAANADEAERALSLHSSALENVATNPASALDASWVAENLVEKNGWSLAGDSVLFRRMTQMILRGQIESNERQRQELAGEPVRILDERFGADKYRMDRDRASPKAGPSLTDLLERYIRERKPKPPTRKAYRLHLQPFIDFVQHDDAARISTKDIIRWKDELQTRKSKKGKPFSPNTINGNYLRVLRIVLGFAAENLLIPSNPASGVKMRAAKGATQEGRSLTDNEAITILRATLGDPNPRKTREQNRAERWVPWLCAYTGSRVNEITQARAQDVREINGIWTIHITPDAGTVKNDRERTVAIHPHVLEQGFIEAIRGLEGPLFYDVSRKRAGSDANPQYKKVGERLAKWARSLGVDDPKVQPNHGWRHRFKTLARRSGLDPEIRDYIQGHKPRTEGEAYGEIDVEVTLREIKKLPRYGVA